MYRAVIFDIDGTLVDSNDAHARAWVDALARHGRRVDVARVRPLIGMGGDKLLPRIAGVDIESQEGNALDASRRAGIDIIARRSGGWADSELSGAAAIYADPADLLDHFDLSPFVVPAPLRST